MGELVSFASNGTETKGYLAKPASGTGTEISELEAVFPTCRVEPCSPEQLRQRVLALRDGGVPFIDVHELVDPPVEVLVALLAGTDPLELVGQLEHPLGGLVGQGLHDVLLVGEVQVEGAVAGAGPLGDVVDARGWVAALGERLPGRVEQPFARARALRAHGLRDLLVRLSHSG